MCPPQHTRRRTRAAPNPHRGCRTQSTQGLDSLEKSLWTCLRRRAELRVARSLSPTLPSSTSRQAIYHATMQPPRVHGDTFPEVTFLGVVGLLKSGGQQWEGRHGVERLHRRDNSDKGESAGRHQKQGTPHWERVLRFTTSTSSTEAEILLVERGAVKVHLGP